MPRGLDAKSVTEVILYNSCDEHESIVGWAYQPNNETENFSIVGTMQGFSLLGRADCSLRTEEAHGGVEPAEHSVDPLIANNQAELERGVDSSFCNCENTSLSRISNAHKSSQRTATSSLGEVNVTAHGNNSIPLQGKKNNLPETDHASSPLGLFVSKSVSCRISKSDLHKKVAFTLAEVLITLGIIGVVAALTLPTLIQNNQKKQFQVGLQKGYSELLQALDAYKNANGEPLTSKDCYGNAPGIFKNLMKPYLKILVDCGDTQADSNYDKCVQNAWYSEEGKYTYKTYSRKTANENYFDDGQLVLTDGAILMFENPYHAVNLFVSIDVNGFKKGPNQWGVDLFTFQLMEDGKLLPMGMSGTYYVDQGQWCGKDSNQDLNGIACTARALYDKDFWK